VCAIEIRDRRTFGAGRGDAQRCCRNDSYRKKDSKIRLRPKAKKKRGKRVFNPNYLQGIRGVGGPYGRDSYQQLKKDFRRAPEGIRGPVSAGAKLR